MLDSLEAFHISHMYKEGNNLADKCAIIASNGLHIESTKEGHELNDFPILKGYFKFDETG